MNRPELWHRLKHSRITLSSRTDVPPDGEIAIVLKHCPIKAKPFIDFICSLDMPIQKKITPSEVQDDPQLPTA